MDKIAVISDVHGNITALKAVLADISKRGIQRIFCLGDSVLKCVHPDKCVDLLREKCEVVIKGNIDDIVSIYEAANKNYWSRSKIGEERAKYLRSLPIFHEFYMSGYFIRLFHASPISLAHAYNPMYTNETSKYADLKISDPEAMFQNTEFLGKTDKDPIPDIVGYGHIHTPNIVRFKNKTLFNPGSVGIPIEMMNDTTTLATSKFSTLSSYIILEGTYDSKELSSLSFQLVRLPYDLQKEISALQESDMPKKQSIINSLMTAISD